MTAPTVEVAIHGLTDHRPEFVYAVRDERALLGVGFFAEGYTGILSWLDGPTRDTVVHSRMVAVLFVDGDAAGGRPSDNRLGRPHPYQSALVPESVASKRICQSAKSRAAS